MADGRVHVVVFWTAPEGTSCLDGGAGANSPLRQLSPGFRGVRTRDNARRGTQAQLNQRVQLPASSDRGSDRGSAEVGGYGRVYSRSVAWIRKPSDPYRAQAASVAQYTIAWRP